MTLYAIGDIQGCHDAFTALLTSIGFSPERDRLWLVGDLINRGPDSLAVLRDVVALGNRATTVLGNHELHLLATACGARRLGPGDSFDDVLAAPDATTLLDWVRAQPLVHYDAGADRALVHAGIPPRWSVAEALQRGDELAARLQARDWQDYLAEVYADDAAADGGSRPARRARETIDALTRMRFCDRRGNLDFQHSGPPGTQPGHLLPWFDVPGRRARTTHIVFGHWAALGFVRRADISALDSGCVWGGALTALPLEPAGEPVTVSCARSTDGGRK